MIDRWLLPGPAALVATLVAHLLEGRQLVLRAAPQPGLRLAVEERTPPALGTAFRCPNRRRKPRPLLLAGGSPASAMALMPAKALSPGIYWVDDIEPARAVEWGIRSFENGESGGQSEWLGPGPGRCPFTSGHSGAAWPWGYRADCATLEPNSTLGSATYYAMEAEGRANLGNGFELRLPRSSWAALLPDFAALDVPRTVPTLLASAASNFMKLERDVADVGTCVCLFHVSMSFIFGAAENCR